MKHFLLSLLLAIGLSVDATAQTTAIDTTAQAEVLLETTEGNIRMRLYNETPLHRDNFLKLVKKHVYDSLLFHRTIRNFMIQTGDIFSKNAEPGQTLGTGTFDYNVAAEIRLPAIYHKRGAVAAAREGDDVNPEHKSDACQFYIVWGKTQSSAAIDEQQERIDSLFADSIKLSPEAVSTYRKVGGTPHLDGTYTVFGEVTEGLDVVDRIQRSRTDDYDRPIDDIRILRAVVTRDIPSSATPAAKPKQRGKALKAK